MMCIGVVVETDWFLPQHHAFFDMIRDMRVNVTSDNEQIVLQRKTSTFMLGIYGVIIVAVLAVFAITGYVRLASVPDPSKTLNSYCTALRKQDFGMAYRQLDLATQQTANVILFTQFAEDNAGAGNVTDCTVRNVQVTNLSATGNIDYTYANASKHSMFYQLNALNGNWFISNVVIPTPATSLTTYCKAIQSQDFATAYGLVASDVKVQETEAQFADASKRFVQDGGGAIKSCSVANVSSSGNGAAGTVTYVSSTGRIATIDYTLTDESGIWRLESQMPHGTSVPSNSSSGDN